MQNNHGEKQLRSELHDDSSTGIPSMPSVTTSSSQPLRPELDTEEFLETQECISQIFGPSIMTDSALEQATGFERRTIRRTRNQYSEGTVTAETNSALDLHERLAEAAEDDRLDIVNDVKALEPDETPAKVTMLSESKVAVTGVASLLQSHMRWGYTVLLPQQGEELPESVDISGEAPTWMVPMDRKTTDVLFAVIDRTTGGIWKSMDRVADRTTHLGKKMIRFFGATTDGAGECNKFMSEKEVAFGIAPFHRICNLHGTCKSSQAVLLHQKGFLTSCANNAQSMQRTGNKSKAQQATEKLIEERLYIMDVPPTEAEQRKKQAILDLAYGPTHVLSPQEAADKEGVYYCFSGDLEGENAHGHFCNVLCGPRLADCVSVCKTYAVPALYRLAHKPFNKAKWAKQEKMFLF